MKTLTPLEILDKLETKKSILGVQGTEIAIKACELYAAQFQSQPSISAEEFLKEKGIPSKFKYMEPKMDAGIDSFPIEINLIELLTEFASRQGKLVEIKKEVECKPVYNRAVDAHGCGTCGLLVEENEKYCHNCGSKINWK